MTDDALRVVYANPAACRLAGYTMEQLQGRFLDDLVAESDRGAFRDLLVTTIREPGGVASVRCHLHAVDHATHGLKVPRRTCLTIPRYARSSSTCVT